jgi:hypothetical protein
MSKKRYGKRKKSSPSRQFPWLVLVVGALLLIVGGGLVILNSAGTSTATSADGAGAPKLAVDTSSIDEGYLKYDTPIQTAFRLRNVGEQPLKILGEPQVELVEGC